MSEANCVPSREEFLAQRVADLERDNAALKARLDKHERPLTINLNSSDTMKAVMRLLQQAQNSGRFMVAIWYLTDGKLQLRRATWDFPFAEFGNSLTKLREDLDKETKLPTTPLPVAQLPPRS